MKLILKDVWIEAFNSISSKINHISNSKGFNKKWNDGEKIALMHSELSEALEALRSEKELMSNHIKEFLLVEEEFADVIIRIMHFGYKSNLRIAEALIAKVEFNKTRIFKHGKKF